MCSEIGWHKWAARHWISWTWGDITALQRSTHNVIGDKGWVLYFSRLTSWSECPGQLDGSSDTCGRCPVMGNLSRAPVIGSCRAQHLLAHGHSTAMVVHGCGSIASTVGDTRHHSDTHCPTKPWPLSTWRCAIYSWDGWNDTGAQGIVSLATSEVLSCGTARLIKIHLTSGF